VTSDGADQGAENTCTGRHFSDLLGAFRDYDPPEPSEFAPDLEQRLASLEERLRAMEAREEPPIVSDGMLAEQIAYQQRLNGMEVCKQTVPLSGDMKSDGLMRLTMLDANLGDAWCGPIIRVSDRCNQPCHEGRRAIPDEQVHVFRRARKRFAAFKARCGEFFRSRKAAPKDVAVGVEKKLSK